MNKLASIPISRSWGLHFTHINYGLPDTEPTQYTNLFDTLYPDNYNAGFNEYVDSAYSAIGIKVKSNDGNIYQVAYKEYLQVKLNQPLTAGVYYVSFFVTRSKNTSKYTSGSWEHNYGNTLRSLCALFSHNSIIAPFPTYFSPKTE